jgi:glycosyltransferase involved in cell wall biosynthesis
MRVLYVSHTGLVGGAERVLVDVLERLPPAVEPHVLSPPGPLRAMLAGGPVAWHPSAGGDISFRLDPVATPAAALRTLRSAASVAHVARRIGAQVVHANSVRAALTASAARAAGAPPFIAHVHDALPDTQLSRLVRRHLLRRAACTVAVSDFAADRFRVPGGRRGDVEVLHSPVDVARLRARRCEPAVARRRLGLPSDVPVLGLIGQITPWKGQDLAIEALALLSASFPTARLLVVGEPKFVTPAVRYDNPAFERRLRRLVHSYGLDARVHFLGEREDVPEIVSALDVLLVGSWEEPLSRSMLEGMALGVPVVATDTGGPAEVIEDGRTGFLVPPRDVTAWAAVLERVLAGDFDHEGLRRRAAAVVEARFDVEPFVDRLVGLYEAVAA